MSNRIHFAFRGVQNGQSATEFLVIFPVLVFLVFGVIQFALLYQARATLNHATLLAARAGAMHNGDQGDMRTALTTGLTPLFASSADAAGYGVAYGKALIETTALYTKIEVLNPTPAAMNDFGRTRLDGISGKELPNDTLAYRTTTPGSNSKISVQDANILHVRVTYCARLIVPVIDRVLFSAVNALTPANAALSANGMSDPFGTADEPLVPSCVSSLLGGRRIPIQGEAFIRMQSPFYNSNL